MIGGRRTAPLLAGLGAAVTWLAIGCGPPAGHFSIVFEPPEPPPDPSDVLYAYVWVEERLPEEPRDPGVQVADSELARYVPGVTISLSEVPNRSNLVVAAELKEAPQKNAAARYYGESELFTIGPGVDVEVSVRLHLTTAPEPPSDEQLERILYKRAPWGSAANAGAPLFTLEGEAGAVTPGAWVVASEGPSASAELGRVEAGSDGAFGPLVLDSDRPAVWIAIADDIERTSSPVLVPHVELTTTMGGKVTGSTVVNPHFSDVRNVDTGALFQRAGRAATEVGDFPHGPVGGRGSWHQPSAAAPSARHGHAMAYDGARGRIVMFGGSGGIRAVGAATWEWDGTRWLEAQPADPEADGNPLAGYAAAMAYDGGRGRVVMFGGLTGIGVAAATTWEWDGTSWALAAPTDPEGDGDPVARYAQAMAFDAARGRIVMFGGVRDPGGSSDELWGWDGESWALISTADPEGDGDPAPRSSHAMAYDCGRDRLVLFGGDDEGGVSRDDTWEWDGVSWTLESPTDPQGDGNPGPHSSHAMAYDHERGAVILFAGAEGLALGDPWAWDGVSWQRLTVADPERDGNPPARNRHAVVFDRARRTALLFAGSTTSSTGLDDTWGWNGASWTRLAADNENRAPVTPSSPAIAYASDRDRLVLFGGFDEDDGTHDSNETWEWDGRGWTHLEPADPEGDGGPAGRRDHAVVFDRTRGAVFLFGGDQDGLLFADAWRWDGVSWALVLPDDPQADGNPPATTRHAMAFDVARDRVVLFGGCSGDPCGVVNDLWEWDGASWAQITPTDPEADGDPAPRSGHVMTYDEARARVVIFGGADEGTGAEFQDTWTWDGSSWAQSAPNDPEGDGDPEPRAAHAAAYDSARERWVLFAGRSAGGELSDTWEWDGLSWARVFSIDPERDGNPEPRGDHAMAFDTLHQRVVAFGGGNATDRFGGVWLWDGGSWAQVQDEPRARRAHAMAFDEARDKTVLFGGYYFAGESRRTNDTWEWDGLRWTHVVTVDPEGDGDPPPRSSHAMAYDRARGRVVLYGGQGAPSVWYDDTWEWDGASWRRAIPTDPEGDGNPTWKADHSMVYDRERGVVVMHGGKDLREDVWEWDGVSWRRVTPTDAAGDGNPALRWDHGLAYDIHRNRVVTFGGNDLNGLFGGVWEWDGADWLRMPQLDPEGDGDPATRADHTMVYDSARRKVVLYGGWALDFTESFSDAWEWDGLSWARLTPADLWGDDEPLGRSGHAATFDELRGKMVVFGGADWSFIEKDDTWEWDGHAGSRPGATMRAALVPAAVPQDAVLTRLSATWYAGGRGYPPPSCAAIDGADLSVWDRGGWLPVTGNADGTGTAGLLEWSTTDPQQLSTVAFGSERTISFAVTPGAPNGCGASYGELVIDYAEVRVGYRLTTATQD